MLNFIRNIFVQKELARLATDHRIRAAFKSFDEINKILLLAYVNNIDQVKSLKKVTSKFSDENKDVTLAVFYPAKELSDEMLIENGVHFLCFKDTNWKQLPELTNISFVNKVPFDLVVDFSEIVSPQIANIAYSSKAPLIVARSLDDTFADFTIKIPSHKDETFLAEQIIFYLRTIKSK